MGIDAARGEYIAFVDSDDTIDAGAYQQIIRVIREHKPDVIDFGWKYIDLQGNASCRHHKLPKNTLLVNEQIEKLILPRMLNLCSDEDVFINPVCWNKVMRQDILNIGKVRFQENQRVWENRPFVAHYLKFCSSYYSIEDYFYNYIGTMGSLGKQYFPQFFGDHSMDIWEVCAVVWKSA